MSAHEAAVVDTNIIAALKLYDPSELPDLILITAVTMGQLSLGPHATDDPVKRAGRVAVLQHVEATFDPLPYDQGAARFYGQICAAVRAAGRGFHERQIFFNGVMADVALEHLLETIWKVVQASR